MGKAQMVKEEGPQNRIVHLVHNKTNGSIRAKEPLAVKKGDTLEFVSDDGEVNVWLKPKGLFSATIFTRGSQPIKVLKSGTGRICWGLVVNGVTFGYPKSTRFGHNVET